MQTGTGERAGAEFRSVLAGIFDDDISMRMEGASAVMDGICGAVKEMAATEEL